MSRARHVRDPLDAAAVHGTGGTWALLSAAFLSTGDYTADVYTQQGLDWIEENTMKSVLIRHFPRLTATLRGVENAFFPWKPTG